MGRSLEQVEEDVALTWRSGDDYGNRDVRVEELDADQVEEWTDGSRIEGRAAGATSEEGIYDTYIWAH